MLPGPDQFGAAAGDLGISEKDTIVVYDGSGLYSAPRVWWTFRIFGARNVYILDGGLPAWKADNRPTEAGTVKRPKKTFNAEMDTGAVAMPRSFTALSVCADTPCAVTARTSATSVANRFI